MNESGPKSERALQKSPESFSARQDQWNKKLAELKTPDVYTYVIDPNVIETVAALQLLGFNTTQSDQGNYSGTPSVQVEYPYPGDVYIGEREIKTNLMSKLGVLPEEINEMSPIFNRSKQVEIEEGARRQLLDEGAAFTKEYTEWQNNTLELAQKLQSLINDFYKEQPIPGGASDNKVSVEFPYRTSNHPAYIQDTPLLQVISPVPNSEDTYEQGREEILTHKRQEMERFTKFLKDRFLALN